MSDAVKTLADAMAAYPARLRDLIGDASAAALYYRPGPDEWSIVEVVGHLEDVDALFWGRAHRALTEDMPAFTVYDTNGPVRARDFQRQAWAGVWAIFTARRAAFVEWLRARTAADLERAGTHPMHGVMDLTRIPASIPRHDETHYQQIANNLKSFAAQ